VVVGGSVVTGCGTDVVGPVDTVGLVVEVGGALVVVDGAVVDGTVVDGAVTTSQPSPASARRPHA
jgi:hypothetical protein